MITARRIWRALQCAPFVFLALVPAGHAAADEIIEWNVAITAAAEALTKQEFAPPLETRAFTIVHLAALRALDEAERANADSRAALGRAAHDCAVELIPKHAVAFDALLDAQLLRIADSGAKSAGVAIGAAVAVNLLDARKTDGFAEAEGPYTPGTAPGDYQLTVPGYAHYPALGRATPFAMTGTAQFRAPPPYKVTDPEYAFDFNEVRALGAKQSTARSADETAIAIFWFERSGAGWNRVARTLVDRRPMTLRERALLFALLNAAMADALVAGFESKYVYNFWRPVTAIRAADSDGSAATVAVPDWAPLLPTPPMPDYPSTHAALGGAAAAVLAHFLGDDEQEFTFASTMVREFPDLAPRSFKKLSDAAFENAVSRMLVGIHFRRACIAGLEQGYRVGEWVVQHPEFAAGR